jgi:flagellar motility protein MotE (MotC chaperone)
VLDALVLSALLLSGAPAGTTPAAATTPAAPTAPAVPHAAEPEAKHPAAPGTGAEPPAADAGHLPSRPAEKAPAEKSAAEKPAGEKAAGEAPRLDEPPARKSLPTRAGAEGAAAAPRSYSVVPPALSSRALLDELRRTSKDRQSEQAGLAQQAQKLQALQQEIERSRAALRDETARLQAMLASSKPAREPATKEGERPAGARGSGQKPGAKPEPTPLETLAKTARGMKADQAAAMMAQLDRGLAASILDHMKPADAALVLEKMEPATSAALVALLARKDRT